MEGETQKEAIDKIIGEFRQVLTKEKIDLPQETDAVVVLSHAGLSPENSARTEFGVLLVKKITVKRIDLRDDVEVSPEQIAQNGPVLIISGTVEQNQDMGRIAKGLGVPEGKIVIVPNPTPPGANTKTQFELIPDRFKKPGIHLTLVSSDYHGPRVIRTADRNLPHEVKFTFIGMPWKDRYKVFRVVREEVKRILDYSKKGDITRFPKR